jgi:hypothetical protein
LPVINVPYDKFDEEINSALKKMIEFLGFERSSIFELSEDGMYLRYSGAGEGIDSKSKKASCHGSDK